METLKPQFTPGQVLASPSSGPSPAPTQRPPPAPVVDPQEMEELKGQVQDLNEKLETIRSEFDENNNILAHIPLNLTHSVNLADLYRSSYQGYLLLIWKGSMTHCHKLCDDNKSVYSNRLQNRCHSWRRRWGNMAATQISSQLLTKYNLVLNVYSRVPIIRTSVVQKPA